MQLTVDFPGKNYRDFIVFAAFFAEAERLFEVLFFAADFA
jgi:hypothetical protein